MNSIIIITYSLFVGDLQRGESVAQQRENLVATVWRDRRLVYVMSTNSDPRTAATVQRKDRDGTSHTVPCPKNVVDYNKFMGGVDQLRNYYNMRTKSKRSFTDTWFGVPLTAASSILLFSGSSSSH